MGAWGVGALQNDRALDVIDNLDGLGNIDSIAELLLWSRYEEDNVLGAVMILAAFDKRTECHHPEFFDLLYGNENLRQLVGDANNAIYRLIKLKAPSWVDKYKDERIAYLKELKGALEKCANEREWR